ncbi:ferritin-like domain-containing protein [Mycoplasma marinum]|uniref:Ferritin/DPS domain-containing protein n=1 Tax=Mycoplasma marinum TaxID=1937190 RepID=A0A4R0XUD8_9MOLU|nr:ferritin-like domain-containing protein [Mycoplasma marinum]TCG11299.1 hypothetical protein C4B24_02535 [Mycoplasma marinum]
MQNILNDLIVYRSNIQSMHWKMKGPGFLAIHRLTDKMYSQIDEFIDLIAEKFIQRHLEVETTLANAIANSSLKETKGMTIPIDKCIEDLVSQATIILEKAEKEELPKELGAMYVIVDELRDYLEKTIWLLEKSI